MTIVRQRAGGDCGVAALATVAGISYEDAYVAVDKIDPKRRGKAGLHNREVIQAARRLALQLVPTRRYDLDEDEGILRVRWSGRKASENPGGHFVAVLDGRILCPSDGVGLPWSEYLTRYQARACTLLRGDL